MTDNLLTKLALTYTGLPYIWGGQDRHGVDCSGLVVCCLRSLGVLGPKEDLTSRGLAARWAKVTDPQEGDLAYYCGKTDPKITHVGIVLAGGPDPLIIEAGLGGSKDTWTPGGAESWAVYCARQTRAGKIVEVRRQSAILARGKRLSCYNRPGVSNAQP